MAMVAVLVAWGCADVDSPSPTYEREAALTGATLDSGDPPVVAILFGDHAECTGVLVGTRVVLTAAHCLVTHSVRPRVLFGRDSADAVAIVDVAEILVHADFNPLGRAHDIAALRLGGDAPVGVVPISLPPRSFVAGAAGAIVRLVGFGHDSDVAAAGTAHVKREGTASITAIEANTIALAPAPSQACVGDSGGPVLATPSGGEVLVGLVLGGITSCTDVATALRIDSYLDSFVGPVLAGAADPTTSGTPIADGGCSVAHNGSRPSTWLVVWILGACALRTRGRKTPI